LIEVTFYCDRAQKYPGPGLEKILENFSKLESSHVTTRIVDRESLEGEEQVIDEIRGIRPQSRGAVVASGGSALPISGSKKLNLQNTPVILARDGRRPVYVFPCKIGERYYSVESGISFLRQNLPNLVELEGEMEDVLVSVISVAPHKLEDGLVLDDQEFDTPTGKTDLVLKDGSGKTLVVEVEREASDASVGQILRLSAGFEEHVGMKPNSVRAGIACYRINENVVAACRRAGIEVWKYDAKIKEFRKVSKS
jgi:hypothetical protein